MPTTAFGRFGFWLAVGLPIIVGAIVAGYWALGGFEKRVPVVEIGGPFALTDHEGQARTDADFAGQYRLVYFGYTYCPDICPTELSTIGQALDILADKDSGKAEAVTPIFISVDPERDTVDALADYVPHFHPRMVGLTGEIPAVKEVAKHYRVFFQKVESPEFADYLVDHSTYVFLMGPEGGYRTHFTHGTTAEEMAAAMSEWVTSGG